MTDLTSYKCKATANISRSPPVLRAVLPILVVTTGTIKTPQADDGEECPTRHVYGTPYAVLNNNTKGRRLLAAAQGCKDPW